MTITERILVIDYGGQYTHLISRRCRELGVYSEIIPQDTKLNKNMLQGVKGIILSGGPRVVDGSDLGTPFQENISILKEMKIPALGICFGHQLLAVANGANLEGGGNPEYGNTDILVSKDSSILSNLDKEQTVWMSHSDQVIGLPRRDGLTDHFKGLARMGRGIALAEL